MYSAQFDPYGIAVNMQGRNQMTKLIDNSVYRKKKLKELILKLHHGESEVCVG